MIKSFSLFLTLFLISPTFAQEQDKQVKQIKKWYTAIEANESEFIEVPLSMFTDKEYVTGGSSEIIGYFDKKKKRIRKIVERTYDDWAEEVTSYYFNEGKLFFMYSRGNTPGEMYTAEELEISEDELWQRGGEAKTLTFFQNRYYIQNDSCFQQLNKQKVVDADQEADLEKVKNEKVTIDHLSVTLQIRHAYRMYKQFMIIQETKK